MSHLRRTLPPLSTLLPFEAAARLGSFSRAADELHVTQAAVSRHIKTLETELGEPMFLRQHRRVVLTDAGRRLSEAVRDGFQTIAGVAEDVRQSGYFETVTIYSELALAAYWLMPRLAIFEQNHPDIQVRVISSSQPLDRVTDHFDIGLQTSPLTGQQLKPAFAVREEIFPICSPDYLARRGGVLTLANLPRETLLSLRDEAFNWIDWEAFFTHFGVAAPDEKQMRIHNSYPVLLQAVISGQGIALGWRHSTSRLLEDGTLVRVLDETFEVEDGVFAFTPRGLKRGSDAETVFRWIGDELQADSRSESQEFARPLRQTWAGSP